MVEVNTESKRIGVIIKKPYVVKGKEIVWIDVTSDFFPAIYCIMPAYQENMLHHNILLINQMYNTLFEIYNESEKPRCTQALFKVMQREKGIWNMFPYVNVMKKNIDYINAVFLNAGDKYRQRDAIVDLEKKIYIAVEHHSEIL